MQSEGEQKLCGDLLQKDVTRKNRLLDYRPPPGPLHYFSPSYLMRDLPLSCSFIVEDLTLQIVAFRSRLLAVVSRVAVQ